MLPDKFDIRKRFDQEYRTRRGIIETIISHPPNEENILLAA